MSESDEQTPPRPSPGQMAAVAEKVEQDPVYMWSYLLVRSVIGVLGLALPVLLIAADNWLGDGRAVRGSLSAYYHSGARDVFVGTLFMTGIFLIAYKVFSKSWENAMSFLAGIAALGVALFPTGLPKAEESRLTPLQQSLGESVVTPIHFTSAFVFIAMLGGICCLFAKRENKRDHEEPAEQRKRGFWGPFHYLCAGVILLSVLYVALTKWFGLWQGHSLLIGEVAAVAAFGASWLAKGAEIRKLWPRHTSDRTPVTG